MVLVLSANENAQLAGKKTIQPADVLAALKEQEFEGMVEKLEAELKSEFSSLNFPLNFLLFFLVNLNRIARILSCSSPRILCPTCTSYLPCRVQDRHPWSTVLVHCQHRC